LTRFGFLSATLWLVSIGPGAWAGVEVVPRVGVDFEHFGERYGISDEQDTVSTINDVGTLLGVLLRSSSVSPWSFQIDADAHLGKETRRFRLDVDGRREFEGQALALDIEGTFRAFDEGGDYSVAGDHLQEYARLTWERDLSEKIRVRLRESADLTWYSDPNEYNLTSILHRPGGDLRFEFGDLNELRLGYHFGRRSVPDSTSLDYTRHTAELGFNLLPSLSTSIDLSSQLERRIYDEESMRESFWEARTDAALELGVERVSFRLVHENEILRYDEPDELDFDSNWARTGFQVEVHRSLSMDLSLMPLYAFLTSSSAPEEEYSETGIELAIDWRIGSRTWINLAHEIGRRDYERNVSEESDDLSGETLEAADAELAEEPIFSDYTYNRLTCLLTLALLRGVSLDLFANWQPENHRVNRHDTDTRIVSGGIEYRF
jgi:hypothetical protein